MTSTKQQQTDAYYREAHWQMTQEAARQRVRGRRLEVATGDALRIATTLAETVESECQPEDDLCHGHDLYDGECALLHDLNRLVSILGGVR